MHTSNPVREPEILLQEAGPETLLYSPEGKAVHVLNSTARFVWERCDGQHTVDDIARELRESFAIPPERDARADVQSTLRDFAQKGLVGRVQQG